MGIGSSILFQCITIIVTGGTDVSTVHCQSEGNNESVQAVDLERDDAEIELIRRAIAKKDILVLCICRGMQILNVVLGGSRLAHIMDADRVNTYSGHHQAVDRIAVGLEVAATSPDGIIEALVAPEHPWLIGVQWHPKKSTENDPTQQRLFDELVVSAEMRRTLEK